jgi:hypothetical protein
MMIQWLLGISGAIYFGLGTLHLGYTFFTPKFKPYDASVEEGMKRTNPLLTRQTTMWKAWMGFNASHSTGAMFFGFMLLYFALSKQRTFEDSSILQAVAMLNSIFYLGLAKSYWFRIPFTGIALATASMVLSIILINFF